jgi:hypothetical protein
MTLNLLTRAYHLPHFLNHINLVHTVLSYFSKSNFDSILPLSVLFPLIKTLKFIALLTKDRRVTLKLVKFALRLTTCDNRRRILNLGTRWKQSAFNSGRIILEEELCGTQALGWELERVWTFRRRE